MKLELKHLAGYLPYGLSYFIDGEEKAFKMNGIYDFEDVYNDIFGDTPIFNIKPILRPLSDLTKEIEVNGEKFVPIDEICKIHQLEFVDGLFNDYISNEFTAKWLPFLVVQKLLGWHFDIYGLIENGLAIDINTLNK